MLRNSGTPTVCVCVCETGLHNQVNKSVQTHSLSLSVQRLAQGQQGSSGQSVFLCDIISGAEPIRQSIDCSVDDAVRICSFPPLNQCELNKVRFVGFKLLLQQTEKLTNNL